MNSRRSSDPPLPSLSLSGWEPTLGGWEPSSYMSSDSDAQTSGGEYDEDEGDDSNSEFVEYDSSLGDQTDEEEEEFSLIEHSQIERYRQFHPCLSSCIVNVVFVFVSDESEEKSLAKFRNKGTDAVPLTMFSLWLMRKAKMKANYGNMMFKAFSRYSAVPCSLYHARQLEDLLIPPLVCSPRFIPIFNVQGWRSKPLTCSILCCCQHDISMKPLCEVPLQQSKAGGPTKLFYFNFNDIIKRLLKQEAAKGLSAPLFFLP